MNTAKPWTRFLLIAGYIAMLVGAIDPMEGSLLILPGSALVALGTYFSDEQRPMFSVRLRAFILILIGVGALFGFSMLGGIGGDSAYSGWWALLLLPYPIGWSMGIWGPGSPRWVLWSGILVGMWYLFMPILMTMLRGEDWLEEFGIVGLLLATMGIITIGGCIYRLRRRAV
jgi:hypothetical protein